MSSPPKASSASSAKRTEPCKEQTMKCGLERFGYSEYTVTYLDYWDDVQTKEFHGRSLQEAKASALRDIDVMEIVTIELS